MNELYHYGIKGMKWGVRRNRKSATKNKVKSKQDKAAKKALKRKKVDLSNENLYKNYFEGMTVGNARAAMGAAGAAIGIAAVGSAATYALAKMGKKQAATSVYRLARKNVSTLKGVAIVATGAAAVNYLLTKDGGVREYLKEEKRIRNLKE